MKIGGTISQVISKRGKSPQIRFDFLLGALDVIQFQLWLDRQTVLAFIIEEQAEQLPLEPRPPEELDAEHALAAAGAR